ncbi:hypothetical protein [Nakamurella endophytica]|uniref:Uncharacterized protein n=1 Tax=Nakamurella endophytica TaxID=1748367 RepID=A0A917WCK8_9ACTN|nr:hypothetical protein [Nakamurella endophytica]GGL91773.1 hypothetical protein GCM10011594_09450 [Nakamurella endophytica]
MTESEFRSPSRFQAVQEMVGGFPTDWSAGNLPDLRRTADGSPCAVRTTCPTAIFVVDGEGRQVLATEVGVDADIDLELRRAGWRCTAPWRVDQFGRPCVVVEPLEPSASPVRMALGLRPAP